MPQVQTKIMVVEDEGLIARDLEGRLRKCGYDVPAIASSGEEALRKAAETRPDLVLMDIRLKGDMDGIQTAQQVRVRFDIPVIYMTAHTDQATLDRAKLTEPFGFLTKPLGNANLPSSIEMALYKHRSEQKLREREAWLSSVLNATGSAVLVANLAGEIQFLNPPAERFTGWTHAEAVNRPLTEVVKVFYADSDGPADDLLRDPIDRREDSPLPPDLVLVSRDGHRIEIEGTLALREGIILTIRDVTQRKLQDQQLRREQKMQAIGRLAGGVAHDFNNLLTVILGHSEELLTQLPEGGTMRESVIEMQRAGLTAAAVSRQLLSFSRQKAKTPDKLDLNAAIISVTSILKRSLGASIEMRTLLDSDAGWVVAGSGQIEQILLNLTLNAFDAMPRGGEVQIETSAVSLETETFARLAITDTGSGMTKEVADHLFEPFFTTKRDGHGAGLGLAIVHEIVAELGGHISVQSKPGEGTQFEVFLPQVSNPNASKPTQKENAPPFGLQKTILLVEDQEAIRRMLTRYFDRQGFTTILAADGVEALEMAGGYDGKIDLLVSDVIMPRMNGTELAEKLTTLRPKMKTLFISGFCSEIPDKPGFSMLAKPFTQEDLLRNVRQALAEKEE